MTESQIQKQIIDYLKSLGALVFRMNSGNAKHNVKLAPSGTPDLLVVLRTQTVWIEVKTETGTLRDSQRFMIKELEARGQRVIIARCLDDVIEEIK